MPVLPSYRNQSIDLLCKLIDCFLYETTLAFDGLICNLCFYKEDLYHKSLIIDQS